MRLAPFAPFALSLFSAACATGTPPGPAPAPPSPVPAVTPSPPLPPRGEAPSSEPSERSASQRARDEARAPLARAILDAFTNASPELSADGKKLVFASRRDGTRQYFLAEVANPSAAPLALTRGPERAASATLAKDGRSLLFLRDVGVDENYRIYQVGLDGKNETCLTPGPTLRRSLPIEPEKRPGTLVYTQRDIKSSATDLVVQRIGQPPAVVYTDPMPATLTAVAPDGTRALVRRRYSSSNYVLFEIDLGSGTLRRLYPKEGANAVVHGSTYAPGARRVYVAVDAGEAGRSLLAIDPASSALEGEYRATDLPASPIAEVLASPKGGSVAITIDAGDHTEARILDAGTLKVAAKVRAPLGTITLSHYSHDGTRIGATISHPEAPTDVFAVDAKTGAIAALRSDPRPGLEALEPLETRIETVTAFDGLSIPVIVSLPRGARSSGRRLPVLVHFHGGPSDSAAVGWDTFARFFTSLGYAFLEPNVRGSTGYGRAYEMADNRERRADWLRDLESVNAWTRAEPWADPERVVAMGGSYGGYTVLMALTRQPGLWRAGVDYVGIANLLTFLRSTDQAIRAVWVDEFGDLEKDRELLERFSPLREIDEISAPLYVYAGQNDPRVPREESDQVVSALRARHVPVEYQVAANEGHSLEHVENRVEFLTRVARFLEDNLR